MSQVIKQKIANLCANVGDKHYTIKQIEKELVELYAKLDQLRNELESVNGSQAAK